MLPRTPDPLDVMVGARIRIFRTHRGMSQTDLATKVGVAFQQVQKYEKGANRIGASRLSRIAAVLGVPIGDLFEPSEDKPVGNKSGDAKSPFRLLAGRDELRVLKAYSRISDPRLRRAIAQLVEIAADQQAAGVPSIARANTAQPRKRGRKV
jgi:transcriptional regulator with XRE-family HTH domain